MAWIFWILIVFVLTFVEVITINLVTIWFILAGILTCLLSLFIDSFIIQVIIFCALGTILVFTAKDKIKNLINKIKKKK